MGEINSKKNGSVLLYLNILGLDSHFMFGGSSISIRYQIQHKTFMSSLLTLRQKNNCLKFLVNRIIIELLLQCIE